VCKEAVRPFLSDKALVLREKIMYVSRSIFRSWKAVTSNASTTVGVLRRKISVLVHITCAFDRV